MERASERAGKTSLDTPLALEVDRVPAAFASWYELFPRSWGGLQAVEKQIPAIAELGFDVLYFPPIHPIGVAARKGRNNTLTAGPDDPGSPYAIGGKEGGHDAVHPELGTMDDVRSLTATAREHGMDVALDLALNSSPDHPWLKEHPEWFQQRPDGTLKYAENPPKRYQDIYNFNWDTPAWRELWQAWLDVVLHWVDAGDQVLPRRQPAHEAVPVLGVADQGGPRGRPLGRLPRRGLHPPRGHAPPGEDRLHPVLHVLHLEELPLGARASTSTSSPTGPSASTSAPTSSSTRPTSSTPTCSTAGRPRSPRGSCWRAR